MKKAIVKNVKEKDCHCCNGMAGDQWSWIKGLCIPRSRHESKHLSVNDLTSCLMGMFIRGKMDAAHGLSQAGTNA